MSAITFDSIARFMPPDTPLNQQEKEGIASMFTRHRLKKNEHFLREGQHVYHIGCVTHGIIYRWNSCEKGKTHVDQIIGNDHFFTEYKCYQENKPSKFFITAITPCEILAISTSNLDTLIKSNPEIDRLKAEITAKVMQIRRDQDELFLKGTNLEKIINFYAYFGPLAKLIPNELKASLLQMSISEFYDIQKKYFIKTTNLDTFPLF